MGYLQEFEDQPPRGPFPRRINMPRVVHFEIHAEDPERAARFYEKALGWTINKWEGPVEYWLVTTGPKEQPGINGGIVHRRGPIDGESVIAFVCTVDVENLDETMKAVESSGGQIVVPKNAIPGVGWLAYGKDTEGNIFGIMQSDEQAR
jgi:predicted enzyme related to lactoylglutathione lyase